MRNLTIIREKSFVGCLAKMKIYIEDHDYRENYINDTPCRKIGELKNGQQDTFVIGDEAAKVFVIFDNLSKGYCSEFYQLPEGAEDITLTGKNRYNPATGNAFRFDNNENPEVIENRKKGNKKGVLIIVVAAIVGFIIGLMGSFGDKPEAKTFSSDGMTITLTDEFYESEIDGFTVAYGSADVAVFALKEPFTALEGFEDYTLSQYAELVKEANELTSSEVKTADGLTYFEYEAYNSDNKITYRYTAYVYKAGDAFWMIQFAADKKKADDYAKQIRSWAETVEFSAQSIF